MLADSALRVFMAYTLPVDEVPGLGTVLYLVTSAIVLVVTNVFYIFSGLFDMRSSLYAPLAGVPETQDAGPARPEETGQPLATGSQSGRRGMPER